MSLLGWRCGGALLLKLKLKLNTMAAASSATASASTTSSSLLNLIRHNSKRCLSFASNHEEEKNSHSQCPHQHSSSKARILVRGHSRGDKGMDFYSAEMLNEGGSVNIGPATLVATVPFDFLYGNDVEYFKLVNGFLCFQNMEAVNILNVSAPPQSLALLSPVSEIQFSGLGFDPLSNQFKFFSWPRGNRESPSIFTFGNCNGNDNDNGNGGSNSWRQLAPEEFYGADLLCNKFFLNKVGVSANGALYWLTKWVTNCDRLPPKIVAFDLHDEIFRLVPYPDGAKLDVRNHDGHLAAVCGRLAFIEKLQPDKLNIWILEEDYHNCNYSWVKQTIRFPFDWSKLKLLSRILAINTNTDEIFLELDVNHCSLVYYNTKTESMKRLEITGLPHWSEPVHCKLVGITFDDERG